MQYAFCNNMTLDFSIQIQAVQKIKGVESLIIESSWVEPLNPVGSFILDSQAINLCDLSSFKWHSQSPLALIGKVLGYDSGDFVEIFPHFGFAQIVTSL